MKTLKNTLCLFLSILLLTGCDQFLDVKPDKAMVVPRSLEDLEGLLDDDVLRNMNTGPGIPVLSSDDLYTTDQGFISLSNLERNVYAWQEEVFAGEPIISEWAIPYRQVLNANLVLENIEKVDPKSPQEQTKKNTIKGRALFYRAFAFHQLMEAFSLPIAESNPSTLGILLRKSANINIRYQRATLPETYETIIEDLEEASTLLPDLPDFKSRPSKAAAHALLSRVFLFGGEYQKSLEQANLALALFPELLDYNSVNPSAAFPFSGYQDEVIFQQMVTGYGFLYSNEVFVSEELLDFYEENDLRRTLFFTNGDSMANFRGNYTGQVFLFTGMASDEIRFNKMECLARLNRVAEAADMLNEFLESRFVSGTFEPLDLSVSGSALESILRERRKSLLFRDIRWMDLRRLNSDPVFAIELKRELNGETFTLAPKSPKYTFPIPDDEIRLNNVIQNPRN
ncbi:RagB/SusD family nutrient uptake outer membrane protein [Aquiflexum gelatinilyticum]|uniref:RagB/SusD family nutrient uptake outer membrane protein n=1 Tax=Aquiflexum gelatinilyticum TaxID=2961943 RepID=UPI0021682281|nr:RagB/SusD family nutrient uptake outer membrane protein [Aquiflexum gelatinilyticum]MCS4434216.1 RagB/SusD family nutrient uptake outer membrane protein [Aquiflexum gelatinilyticum]